MKLVLRDISKTYGRETALRPTTIEILEGEFLTVLGPSGSGKTTILKMLGGFVSPSSGSISLDGVDITSVPPFRRPFNTVFQDYALFPHMRVGDNVGYGLMLRKTPRGKIREAVGQALDIVGLRGMESRLPHQLSGGQQQRVALARALVCEPKVLLLDEPLSALDAEMRRQMQVFLKELHQKVGTTFLLVTHDQEEAITLSDRIVVMNTGRIEQIGTPHDLYYRPRSEFVAGFLGDNNLLPGTFAGGNRIVTELGPIQCADSSTKTDGDVLVAIRPEQILIGGEPANRFRGRIKRTIFAGAFNHIHIVPDEAPSVEIHAKQAAGGPATSLEAGAAVTFGFGPQDFALVPRNSAP